ncbi:uncharacterized protein [Temnothorax longispinosus]|uniref:uncharacterized protein isoform X5 n=1 Tax=Temnothorax longispinosus TaxID=300112 RepID=UPI003A9981BC
MVEWYRIARNLCKSACTKSQRLPIGMDFFNNEYYITRHLMESIGLWPYQKPERRMVRVLCVSFILIQTILLQVKNLFDQIHCDWKLIRNMDELKIIKKYAYKTRFYAILSGYFLDLIMPLDEPRQRQLPVQIECFLDQDRYFYLISLIIIIAAFVGMTVIMATENMYMIFVQHSCALFELISYRLTCAFDTCSSKTTPSKTKCRLCTKLLSAFSTHQHCLEFVENMQHKFSTSYFVLFVFGVGSASVNMFRLFEAVTMLNIFEAIATGLFVYSHVAYGFFMNYFGQDIIDHSEYFFQQIYSTQWYRAPLYAQKLLLMTLRQSTKNSKIIVGGLFVMSLEGLATLVSMSLSYCMVMYSVRK